MSYRQPQNPGLGGLDELTSAEETFVQNISGLSYVQGDILYYDGSNITNLGFGTSGQVLKTQGSGANPIWGTVSGAGDVTAASTFGTDNVLIRSDGTSKGVQSSGISISDSDVMTGGNAGGMTVANISGATFTSIQNMQDVFHSAGWVSGGGITDDGDGTITVAAGTGLIRATDSAVAEILFFDWAQEAGANVNLADNDISYVYVEYNAGSPQVVATTTERTDFNTNVLLATIQRTGTTLHISTVDKHSVGDHAGNMIIRLKETLAYGHKSGGILGAPSGLKIALTAGSFWRGLTPFTTSAVDTNAAGTFSYYHQDGSGGFTKTATQTDINNTNYDDGDGTLGTLSNNKYGVHWIYLEADDDDIAVVYGLGDYTLSQAENAQPPSSIPELLQVEGILAGKIIVKKSDSSFTQIESAFQTTFQGSVATDHGGLAGLSDDDHTQYLLADGSRALSANWDVGAFTITGTQFISDIAGGTAPFVVTSSTEVANLKAATATLATTVTTNANLTGIVTSSGNATAIADKAISIAKLADGTDGEIITWSATGVIATVAVGTNGQVLTSGGVGTAPTFEDIVGSGITTLNTLTADTQTFAVGTSGTDFNISSATSTHTFNIPDASASNRGLITNGTQTIAGVKTFSSTLIASGDLKLSAAVPAILDSSDNKYLDFNRATDAINFLRITNSAIGDPVQIVSVGGDTNVSIEFITAGSGIVEILGALTVGGTLTATLTGQADTVATIAGLAPDTATTQATQAAITSAANLVTVGTLSSGNATAIVDAATLTAAGKVELATIAETDTGTDATRAVTPDGLQGSVRNIRYMVFVLIAAGTDVATATTIGGDFTIPFPGVILQDDTLHDQLASTTDTAGTDGTMVVDIHLNGSTIMTTNKLDIETTEKGTQTAATQPDLTTTVVAAGDILTFDIDAVHSTTVAKGLKVLIAIRET